jgi:hypothetical protein
LVFWSKKNLATLACTRIRSYSLVINDSLSERPVAYSLIIGKSSKLNRSMVSGEHGQWSIYVRQIIFEILHNSYVSVFLLALFNSKIG